MSKIRGSKCFVSVYNCRVCGNVIPTAEGVRRHEKVCRLPNDLPREKFQQVSIVKFPCPVVSLKRMPSSIEQKLLEITESAPPPPNRGRRQRSHCSQRAQEIMSIRGSPSWNEDEDTPMKKKRNRIRHIQTQRTVWGISFRRKIITDEKLNKFACPVNGCGARLKRAQQLKQHFIMHLENNPFACPVPGCQLKFGAHFHFNRHIDWHMGRNILSCEMCGQTCADSTRMRRHLSRCKRKPFNPPGLNQRKIIAMEEMKDILKCHYAKLELKKLFVEVEDDLEDDDDTLGLLKFQRRINMDMIIEKDPMFLEVCKVTQEFKDILPRANWRKKFGDCGEIGPKKFKCPKCNKSYGNAHTYRAHYNNAHRHRPYTCSRCGRNYVQKMHLERHMKYHELTGNNIYMKLLKNGNYKCTKCDFESKSKQSANMVRHWFLIHKVVIPNIRRRKDEKKSEMKSDMISIDSDEEEEASVIKIESEPPLELTMIVPENNYLIQGIKWEPNGANKVNQEYQCPRESLMKCEFGYDHDASLPKKVT